MPSKKSADIQGIKSQIKENDLKKMSKNHQKLVTHYKEFEKNQDDHKNKNNLGSKLINLFGFGGKDKSTSESERLSGKSKKGSSSRRNNSASNEISDDKIVFTDNEETKSNKVMNNSSIVDNDYLDKLDIEKQQDKEGTYLVPELTERIKHWE
jgi:hypothetical protein